MSEAVHRLGHRGPRVLSTRLLIFLPPHSDRQEAILLRGLELVRDHLEFDRRLELRRASNAPCNPLVRRRRSAQAHLEHRRCSPTFELDVAVLLVEVRAPGDLHDDLLLTW